MAALALVLAGSVVAGPAEAKPMWTKPQQLAPRGVGVDFPARVAVGEGGRSLLVFSCDRGGENPRWVRCARWRERNGTMRPLVTLAGSTDRNLDGIVEAVVSSRGVGTVVWLGTRGLELRRVSPSGRVGGGRILTEGRSDVSLVAGADGTVAVGWNSADGARARVIRAGGALGPVQVLPGTHVQALAPHPDGGYAVLTKILVPDAYENYEPVYSDLTVSRIDDRGSVRSSARVSETAGAGDTAVLPGGATVVVWWEKVGDRSVLTERRYPGALEGAYTTHARARTSLRGFAADLIPAPGGRVYLGWQVGVASMHVGVLPPAAGGKLRRTYIGSGSYYLTEEMHAARGRIVVFSPIQSEAGQHLEVWTWDGSGPVSRKRKLLVSHIDFADDDSSTTNRFVVASDGGHVAALTTTTGEVVYRD
ncbi:hypothetical protein [Nocardioides marmotae]|uniref:hypothetical protein n=1 Tax=Nocardioides marmotae TaxID=2663857 RepID=UPI0012B5D5A1|nr:hypothetical protein [Nocardioides marmotae]MBC9731979.1 hypothetical protein [Nocardioides marmotae]MTB83100.1 hypothetical protein [Nocardioides marmotae]